MDKIHLTDKHARVDKYLPQQSNEEFLTQVNEKLRETPQTDSKPQQPVIFVAGAPRSGTTFLAQCLCQYLKVDFIDNLAAKFWLAPATGLRLSTMLFGNSKSSSFASEYGRTQNCDIHGFHYFWMHQLKLNGTEDLFKPLNAKNVDAQEINGHLAAIQQVNNLPIVMKGYYPSYWMKWFAQNVPGSVFVLIRRDPLSQARSIIRARQAYMQSIQDWWSMYPPEFKELISLPAAEQIAGQIFGLRRMYAKQIQECNLPVVVLDYDELLASPKLELERIAQEIIAKSNMKLIIDGVLPEVRSSSYTPLPEQTERELEKAINEYQHWDMRWE